MSAEVQLDLFGEVEAQEAQRKAADDLHSQPATCPCCGTTERNGWLLRNNHGVDPETGGIGGYPVREHPIYGAQCVAQSLVSSHITYYVREGKEDALEREVIRGRELGLDVEAIIEHARIRHMIMPDMSVACGIEILGLGGAGVLTSSKTTCPECIAAGEPYGGLSRWCFVMQGRADLYDAAHQEAT